jgi:hypothetical protein
MKILRSRTAAMLASAAALSISATPALAQSWGGGYGGGYHRHHDDTGAWVVGGIVGIGLLAALASAASKSNRERQARTQDRDYRADDYRGDYQGRDYGRGSDGNDNYRGSYSGRGRSIDGAVDACVGEVERGSTRVDTVDNAGRDGDGWRVTGQVSGGRNFDCAVDGQGRVRRVIVDGRDVN